MNEKNQQIIDDLNKYSGYSEEFKQRVLNLLPNLHFSYSFRTISNNLLILQAVDRVMLRYKVLFPIACTWHDVGPAPFDKDFMAACLSDYNDMFIVLSNPKDQSNSLGIHVSVDMRGEIGYELEILSGKYMTEQNLIELVDSIISEWEK